MGSQIHFYDSLSQTLFWFLLLEAFVCQQRGFVQHLKGKCWFSWAVGSGRYFMKLLYSNTGRKVKLPSGFRNRYLVSFARLEPGKTLCFLCWSSCQPVVKVTGCSVFLGWMYWSTRMLEREDDTICWSLVMATEYNWQVSKWVLSDLFSRNIQEGGWMGRLIS